jgi:hypothetical protein
MHNGIKRFALFDFPHLIKSMRNTVLDNEQLITSDGIVSWRVIEEFYYLDKGFATRMATKLNDIHIHPNSFQKMRVSYATQICSNTVASGIETLHRLKRFSPDNAAKAIPTALFLRKMNNIFDIMNSRKFDSSPYKKPLSEENKFAFEYIDEIIEFLECIKIIRKKNKKEYPVFCISGMIQTLRAIKLIILEVLGPDEGLKFLLTAKLNQDFLENVFAIIRGMGGYNRLPSVREFHNHMRNYVCTKMISPNVIPSTANSKLDMFDEKWTTITGDDTTLTSETSPSKSVSSPETAEDEQPFEFEPEHFEESVPFMEENDLVEVNSNRYFSGYLLRNLNCQKCEEELLKPNAGDANSHEYFIKQKTYENVRNGLKYPSEHFSNIALTYLNVFKRYFYKNFGARQLTQNLKKLCVSQIQQTCPEIYCVI